MNPRLSRVRTAYAESRRCPLLGAADGLLATEQVAHGRSVHERPGPEGVGRHTVRPQVLGEPEREERHAELRDRVGGERREPLRLVEMGGDMVRMWPLSERLRCGMHARETT